MLWSPKKAPRKSSWLAGMEINPATLLCVANIPFCQLRFGIKFLLSALLSRWGVCCVSTNYSTPISIHPRWLTEKFMFL